MVIYLGRKHFLDKIVFLFSIWSPVDNLQCLNFLNVQIYVLIVAHNVFKFKRSTQNCCLGCFVKICIHLNGILHDTILKPTGTHFFLCVKSYSLFNNIMYCMQRVEMLLLTSSIPVGTRFKTILKRRPRLVLFEILFYGGYDLRWD